ncbi:MAG: hypothetical protein KAG37_04105 [Flavobacteriales bacterium]|nr:hypothetical protein [Flavobacteriales bacterium]
MIKHLLHIFSILLISANSLAQASLYEDYERDGLSLQDYNEVLGELGKTIISTKDETLRIENNEVFRNFLKKAIELDKSFDFKFDSVRTMSVLKSEDEQFKIYNWAFPFENGTYLYYGFVQLKTERGIRVIELYDQSDVISSYKYRSFYPEKWFGALYYRILTREHKGQTYYTLLGWDGNSPYTTKKIIDVLTIKYGEEIEFGAPIFDLYSEITPKPQRVPPPPYRMVYEYASMVSMKLNWEESDQYIIMDHLSPLNSDKKEFANYYGPDLTFDAFRWIDGKWTLFDNVKAANKNKILTKRKYKRKKRFSLFKNK